MQVCRHAAKCSADKNLYVVIRRISKSPERPKKFRKLLDTEITLIMNKTPRQALAFLLDNFMSKNVNTNMRSEVKSCGVDILPPRNEVREAKVECRPLKEAISIHQIEVEVSFQALLNHTSERVIKLQREVIIRNIERTNSTVIEAVLLCSLGFDGSLENSEYKQCCTSEVSNVGDGNLFATTLIPLRLLSKNNDIL